MVAKLIKTEAEYNQALARLDKIFDAKEDTPKGDEAELLIMLISKYEQAEYPMPEVDPIEAIQMMMEAQGLAQKDLIGIIGSKGRVSEVLNRKKKLTVNMIRSLEAELHIPASTLINEYELSMK